MKRECIMTDINWSVLSGSTFNTTDKKKNQTAILKSMSDNGQSMRLMETIEDGSKIQIVIEDVTPEDAEAVHAYQLAQGRGKLTISESGITYGA